MPASAAGYPETPAVPLDTLKNGERAFVVSVTGQDRDTVRLMELGLVPGVPLTILGGSGPIRRLALHGSRFGLSPDTARTVQVRRIP
ncbi:MAG: ferrous iron transport protein A [Deltaproteobacteria bacterium]|nr:ferrous iron transport protein A [Deltaproteobacteria bacterium]